MSKLLAWGIQLQVPKVGQEKNSKNKILNPSQHSPAYRLREATPGAQDLLICFWQLSASKHCASLSMGFNLMNNFWSKSMEFHQSGVRQMEFH